jgi:carboxyl-terminal processing protease
MCDYINKSSLPQKLMKFILGKIVLISFIIIFSPNAYSNPSDKLYEKLDLFSDVLNTLKKEYVDEVEQSEVIDAAINGMLQSLDPYSGYMSPESFRNMNDDTRGEFGGLGIEITMEGGLVKVITPIEGTPADKAGVEAGDFIIKIDNKQVKGMSLMDAVKLMRGKIGTSIEITVRRPEIDEDLKFKITRAIIKIREVSSEVKNNIGYIRLRAFNEQSHNQMIKQINKLNKNNLNGYILDLRNNPGGLLSQAIKITETFLDGGEIVSTRGRDKNDIKIYNAKKGDVHQKETFNNINKSRISICI